jgi:hypothetical protein
MTIYKIGDQQYQNGEPVQFTPENNDNTTPVTPEVPDDSSWGDILGGAWDALYDMVTTPGESVIGDSWEGFFDSFGADGLGAVVGQSITDFMNSLLGTGGAQDGTTMTPVLEGQSPGTTVNPETGELEQDDGKGKSNETSNNANNNNTNTNTGDHTNDHKGGSGDDGTEPPKDDDPIPPGEMPNPDGGPGTPTSTPNPEGDDGEGIEGSQHGVAFGHGGSGGSGGDGEGEGPGRLGLSQQLSGGGNNQQSGTGDSFHGPHDPGEEMPNPEDTHGGNPTSNVAHGAHDVAHGARDFWSQAAGTSQGVTTGLHVSTIAVSGHASQIAVILNAGATISAHDLAGALSGASGHDDTAHTATVSAHTVTAASAELHGELGTSTLHDSLALHGASIATQMHV